MSNTNDISRYVTRVDDGLIRPMTVRELMSRLNELILHPCPYLTILYVSKRDERHPVDPSGRNTHHVYQSRSAFRQPHP